LFEKSFRSLAAGFGQYLASGQANPRFHKSAAGFAGAGYPATEAAEVIIVNPEQEASRCIEAVAGPDTLHLASQNEFRIGLKNTNDNVLYHSRS
jgi:hypothetical protein